MRGPAAAARFIPAYAGNARLGRSMARGGTVHHRIRGERTPWDSCCWAVVGSSPHTRGTPQRMRTPRFHKRFIPAYAGNAPPSGNSRVRPPGSSPHTRGTPALLQHVTTRRRFIPAYAGNAALSAALARDAAVHPRIRGERLQRRDHDGKNAGSSPHTRGTRFAWLAPFGT